MLGGATTGDDRAQVGIGTLVVFMAMILVAAMAATTLVDVGGMLQSKGHATGEEATGQVTNGVRVTGAFAEVTPNADDAVTNGTVSEVQVVVGKAAGSGIINVTRATVDWIGPKRGTSLAYTSGTTDSQSFTTRNVSGDDAKTLVEASDRIEIVINATAVEENVDDFAGYDDELVGLTAGDEAKLLVTTQYGATTTYWVNVPESLAGRSAVRV